MECAGSDLELSSLKIGFFDSTVASLSAKGIDGGVAEVEQIVGIVVGEVTVLGATPRSFDRIQVGA
ncbi:MAG: hypothetical protein C0483_11300 [Pirellula sp.]|nr:hypothetical protein [Pirellula sp.]